MSLTREYIEETIDYWLEEICFWFSEEEKQEFRDDIALRERIIKNTYRLNLDEDELMKCLDNVWKAEDVLGNDEGAERAIREKERNLERIHAKMVKSKSYVEYLELQSHR